MGSWCSDMRSFTHSRSCPMVAHPCTTVLMQLWAMLPVGVHRFCDLLHDICGGLILLKGYGLT